MQHNHLHIVRATPMWCIKSGHFLTFNVVHQTSADASAHLNPDKPEANQREVSRAKLAYGGTGPAKVLATRFVPEHSPQIHAARDAMGRLPPASMSGGSM